MKKLSSIMLAFVLVFSLVACGKPRHRYWHDTDIQRFYDYDEEFNLIRCAEYFADGSTKWCVEYDEDGNENWIVEYR